MQVVGSPFAANGSGPGLMLDRWLRCYSIDAHPAKGAIKAAVLQPAPAHPERLRIRDREALPTELRRELCPEARRSLVGSHTPTVEAVQRQQSR